MPSTSATKKINSEFPICANPPRPCGSGRHGTFRPEGKGVRADGSARPDYLWAVAWQRQSTLQRIAKLRKTHNVIEAAALCGVSWPTVWRWQKRFTARGLRGLMPKPATGGRHSPFTKLRLPIAAAREIEWFTVEYGSRRAALRQFARNPVCPWVLAQYLARTGHMPERFQRVGRVNRVEATVFASLDGMRLFIKMAGMARAAHRSAAGGSRLFSLTQFLEGAIDDYGKKSSQCACLSP